MGIDVISDISTDVSHCSNQNNHGKNLKILIFVLHYRRAPSYLGVS